MLDFKGYAAYKKTVKHYYVIKQYMYMENKIIGRSDHAREKKQALRELKQKYRYERRQILDHYDCFEFFRSVDDKLRDIPAVFRWFPSLILFICGWIERHRAAAAVVFLLGLVCLTAIVRPWLLAVKHNATATIWIGSYLSVCAGIFAFAFFIFPWIYRVMSRQRTNLRMFVIAQILLSFYVAMMTIWVIRMMSAGAETRFFLFSAFIWAVLCFFTAWQIRKKLAE